MRFDQFSAKLAVADAAVAMHSEQFDHAIDLLEHAKCKTDRISEANLRLIVLYYLARALYKNGDNSRALKTAREAKELVSPQSHGILLAKIEMVEAWILFIQGELKEAERRVGRGRKCAGKRK